MRKFLLAGAALWIAACAALAYGCSGGTVLNHSSAAASGAASAESSSAQASSPAVSAAADVSSSESESSTPVEDFDEFFSMNMLDVMYTQEMNQAATTMEMARTADSFCQAWQNEITNGYDQLLEAAPASELDTVKADQKSWEDGKDAALQKIADDAAKQGGTLAQVNASIQAKDYYRARAEEIYRQLYQYNPNFTFGYEEDED